MRKLFLFLFQAVLFTTVGKGQTCDPGGCSNFFNQFPTGTLTPTTSWTTRSGMNGGNWTLFNVTIGTTYEWTYCETYGGVSSNWDAQLTLYNNSGLSLLCYSDDECGVSGNAPYIRWTATFTGTVRLLTSVFNCQSNAPNPPYSTLAYRSVVSSSYNFGLTVYNINSVLRSNAKVKLYNSNYSVLIQTLYTNASGQVSFAGLTNGTYNYEVFYTPSGNNPLIASNEEFWGSGTVAINGNSVSQAFNRIQPYISSAPSFSPSTLPIGQITSGNFTVKNDLQYSTNSYVEIWVDRNQVNPWDFNSNSSPRSITSGATSTFTFGSISPTNTGTYYFYAFVYSYVNNTYVITDQYAWTSAFTTTCPSLPIPTSAAPGTTSAPGTTLATLTPTLSWSGSSSGIYHVQIWEASTNPTTNTNVIYGFETPISSPGHCISGLSHTIPPGVLVNNGQYKWSVHRNDPCGECESISTLLLYFQINPASCVVPTNQLSNISFSSIGNTAFTTSWSNGNGYKRIIKLNTTNSFTSPVNGTDPPANSTYQNSGEQVVYNGTGNNVSITGLSPNTTYWVRGYEANCSGTSIFFNVTSASGNPNSQATTSTSSPIANFSSPTPIVVVGQGAQFFDLSTNNPSAWNWLVEREQWNGSYTTVASSIQQNPTFYFSTAACYRISLTATNSSGSSNIIKPCYIYATPDLSAPIPSDVTRAQKYYTYKGGDPVNLANGSYTFSMRDLSVPAVKTRFSLERRYFSNSSYESVFGIGWHHSFDIKVNYSNNFDWFVQYPDGHNEHFVPYKDGETRSLYPGNFDTLYYTASGGTITSFTLLKKDGTKWYFDGNGLITSIVDLNNNAAAFNYTSGKLTQIILPGGRDFQFSYNGFNKVSSVADNSGRTVYFFYDPTGHYLDSTRIANSTTSFRYGPYGMTEVFDPRGHRIVQNVYNAQAQVYEQYNADNKKTTFQYDIPASGQTTIIDPLNNSKVITHDNKFRCVEVKDELNAINTYSYSINNTLDTITDARGFKTITQYDYRGNAIKTINAKGFYDSLEYNSFSSPLLIKDREANINKFGYDASNNLTQSISPTGDTTRIEYNGQGLDTAITDPRGYKTRKAYNSKGDLLQLITPTSVTSFKYDAIGRPIEITDSYGRKDSLFWNHFDQVVRKVDKLGRVEEFGYDENGNQILYKNKIGQTTLSFFNNFDQISRVVEPQNHITEYEYDDNQRRRKYRDPNKNTLIFSYDVRGKIVSTVDSVLGTLGQWAYDASGNPVTYIDAVGKTWLYSVDEINRITSVENPLGESVQNKYNKNNQQIERIDEEGRSVKWEYNPSGRLVKTTDAKNNFVQLFLNKIGLPDSIRDARGNIRNKTTYDGSNRIVSVNDGYGNYITAWDSTDNIKYTTDPNNRTLDHVYNANNELIDIKNAGNTLRHYDLNANGDFLTANSNTQVATVTRNALSWVTEYTNTYGNSLQYAYDSVGNVNKIIYPGGKQVEYAYNSIGKCTQIKDWANRIYTITRSKTGAIESIQYPNSFSLTVLRDDASRVKAWINKTNTGLEFQSNLLRRDKTGNVLRDSGLHVLSFALPPQSHSGSYGRDDRTLVYANVTCSTNVSGQRIGSSAPGRVFNFSWSPMSELTSVTFNSSSQTMQYDAFGERVLKNSSLGTHRYIMDHFMADFPLVLQERDGSDNEIIDYLFIPGDGIVLARDSVGTINYYHHDFKGNISALSDMAGQITDRYEYVDLSDSILHIGPSEQPFTWMGAYGAQSERDGLYYMHARYYDGVTSSFISKDPYPFNYFNTQDINRYTYGYNNPLKYQDPTGFCATNNTSYEKDSQTPFQTPLLSDVLGQLGNFIESYSGKTTVGISNLKFYQAGWGGNKYVKTIKLSTIGKTLANGSDLLTLVGDAYDLYKFNKKPNANSLAPGKALADITIISATLVVSTVPAMIIGGSYLLLTLASPTTADKVYRYLTDQLTKGAELFIK